MPDQTPRAKRRRTNNAGIMKIGEREIPVYLRDASETGVRVRVTTAVDIPDTVTLICRMEKIETTCRIIWRRGNDLGLRFEPGT